MLEILAQSLLVATRLHPVDHHDRQSSHQIRQDMLLHERRLREARWQGVRWG